MALELATHRNGGELTLSVCGVIDFATVEQLQAALTAAVADSAATTVTVDLAGVTLLDSLGISALLQGRRHADQHRRCYRVVGAGGIVADVLRITGVWIHLVGDTS